jgi:SET domain-containing protein
MSIVTAPRRPSPAAPSAPSAARIIRVKPTRSKPALVVRKVRGMGRGVFAGRRFRKGEVIEACPVLPVPASQARKCRGEVLDHYLFWWPRPGFPTAIALGFGSIYNHSFTPNARFTPRPARDVMLYIAVRDIEPGEQIFVNYEWPAKDYHF